MPRIPPLDLGAAPAEARAAAAEHARRPAPITNMKRTLLRSLPAFHALMEWYALRDAVEPFLGERATTLFAHAISAETDCLICSTFFRRILIEGGEDPDRLELDEREAALVAFGRRLAVSPHGVPEPVYRPLETWFDAEQIVTLTAFGALMVATNVFNNALEVPLDAHLEPYRRAAGKEEEA